MKTNDSTFDKNMYFVTSAVSYRGFKSSKQEKKYKDKTKGKPEKDKRYK